MIYTLCKHMFIATVLLYCISCAAPTLGAGDLVGEYMASNGETSLILDVSGDIYMVDHELGADLLFGSWEYRNNGVFVTFQGMVIEFSVVSKYRKIDLLLKERSSIRSFLDSWKVAGAYRLEEKSGSQ